jgi:uncharacterized membrane protein
LPSQVEFNDGAVSVRYDPQKWGAPETDKDGLITLDRVGPGTAVLIGEKVGVPANRVCDTIIEEYIKLHPETKVLLRENRTVNGHEGVWLKLSCSAKDIPMIMSIYCFGGLAGTVQVRTVAPAASFDECEPDFNELLNSLEIKPIKHPTLMRMWQGVRFARLLFVLALPTMGFVLIKLAFRTHLLYAIGLTLAFAVAIFLFGWIYELVKYRLK